MVEQASLPAVIGGSRAKSVDLNININLNEADAASFPGSSGRCGAKLLV